MKMENEKQMNLQQRMIQNRLNHLESLNETFDDYSPTRNNHRADFINELRNEYASLGLILR